MQVSRALRIVNTGYDVHMVHGPICGHHDDIRDVSAVSFSATDLGSAFRGHIQVAAEGHNDLTGDGVPDLLLRDPKIYPAMTLFPGSL